MCAFNDTTLSQVRCLFDQVESAEPKCHCCSNNTSLFLTSGLCACAQQQLTVFFVLAGLFHVLQRRFVWPLLIGLSLMFFQQVTGQPSVLYYATRMFEKAGLNMGQQSTGIAGVLGAFKLFMTCMSHILLGVHQDPRQHHHNVNDSHLALTRTLLCFALSLCHINRARS